ncbi:MAG: cytochrome c3 family protein [Desulfobacterota bacterium]|nr:cytochrome c3 family protein [Thermodesulfobacteriota bacterium]MDW8001538.1 cytochrome c3 family protein [Deltaproteobacteria bacterium]
MLVKLRIISFLILLFLFVNPVEAKKEIKDCFKCHTDFEEREYALSVHGQFSCLVCHKDLKVETHIKERRPEKSAWRRSLNETCQMCHDSKTIFAKAEHRKVSDQLLCTDCHNPHLSKSMRTEKKAKSERAYCLICHGNKGLKMRFQNGEEISIYVDEKRFLKSAHGKNPCSFCHLGFSKDRHPKGQYESKMDFVHKLSFSACARCHVDECKRFERCVHGALARKKEKSAPLCSDCHNPHYVTKIKKDDMELHLTSCIRCHKDVYDAYKESVHYKAWEKGKKDAPLCTGCHKPHDVLVTSFNLRNNEVCFECHKEIEKAHTDWFYNPPFKSQSFVKFHFELITCNVCHAKNKEGAVYLHPHDKKSRDPITIEDMKNLLGIDKEKLGPYLDKNRDGYVESRELWEIFDDLLRRGVTLTLIGWMDVRDPILSHFTEPKEKALRSCEVCHRADSPFFRDAFLLFRDEYGWPFVFKAHKDVLSTKSTLSPLSEFYVFGSTRLAIVDFLLIVSVFGALLVPAIHITLRILTRKWRKRGLLHE